MVKMALIIIVLLPQQIGLRRHEDHRTNNVIQPLVHRVVERNPLVPFEIPSVQPYPTQRSSLLLNDPIEVEPVSSKQIISSTKILLVQAGRSITLLTNHFKCHVPRTLKCHQYDIDLEVANRDGAWRPAKKDDRFLVLSLIIKREKFPLVWYDEGKNLYSIDLLVDLKDQYEILIEDKKSNRQQKYRLSIINLVKSYDIQVGFRLRGMKTIACSSSRFFGILLRIELLYVREIRFEFSKHYSNRPLEQIWFA